MTDDLATKLVIFEKEKLNKLKTICKEKDISLNAFIRIVTNKALEEFETKGTINFKKNEKLESEAYPED